MGTAGRSDPVAAADAIVDEAMRDLVVRTGGTDLTVGAALEATAALRRTAADRKLFVLVGFAHDAGASWAAIGEALGVTTQAAHQRFGPKPGARAGHSAS